MLWIARPAKVADCSDLLHGGAPHPQDAMHLNPSLPECILHGRPGAQDKGTGLEDPLVSGFACIGHGCQSGAGTAEGARRSVSRAVVFRLGQPAAHARSHREHHIWPALVHTGRHQPFSAPPVVIPSPLQTRASPRSLTHSASQKVPHRSLKPCVAA